MVGAIEKREQERINLESRTLGLLASNIYAFMGGDGAGTKLESWLPYDLESGRQVIDPETAEIVKRLWRSRRLPLWVGALLKECLS